MKSGVNVNDDRSLEAEADAMGAQSLAMGSSLAPDLLLDTAPIQQAPITQKVPYYTYDSSNHSITPQNGPEEINLEGFQEEYNYAGFMDYGINPCVVKVTEDGTSALIYQDDFLIYTLKRRGDDWEEDAYREEEDINQVLDPDQGEVDIDTLPIAKKFKDAGVPENEIRDYLAPLYNKISELKVIDKCLTLIATAPDVTEFHYSLLLLRLTDRDRSMVKEVLKIGIPTFSTGKILHVIMATPAIAVERINIVLGWGAVDDHYLSLAESMQVKNASSQAHKDATLLAGALAAGHAVVWARHQQDAHYAGGHHQPADPRTGFITATANAHNIIIHAHWHRVAADGQTPGKITSAHVQQGGQNGLEINSWAFLDDVLTAIVNAFNAAGANRPTGAGGVGTLAISK